MGIEQSLCYLCGETGKSKKEGKQGGREEGKKDWGVVFWDLLLPSCLPTCLLTHTDRNTHTLHADQGTWRRVEEEGEGEEAAAGG